MKLDVEPPGVARHRSRPARGVWIETQTLNFLTQDPGSRPARGVWIETLCPRSADAVRRHAPRGACGLKHELFDDAVDALGHAPRGACGLKRVVAVFVPRAPWSRPARGVWIETRNRISCRARRRHAPRGACGLKQLGDIRLMEISKSRPARGVWIETLIRGYCRR